MKKGIIGPNVFARSTAKGALQLVAPTDTLVPEKPWSYIKNLRPSLGRFFHVSQEYKRESFTSEAGVVHEYWTPHFVGSNGLARGRTFFYPKPEAVTASDLAHNPAVEQGVAL